MDRPPVACPPVARLSEVSHHYGAVAALDGVTLALPGGCMVGLIGPDGVGKSSLLALISGARQIQSGQVEVLGGMRERPRRPFVAVLGGAKVSDKLGVIEALRGRVDALVIGGGMCFTFLAAKGHGVGDSICERDQVETCRRLMQDGPPIHLPEDLVGTDGSGAEGRPVERHGRPVVDGAQVAE